MTRSSFQFNTRQQHNGASSGKTRNKEISTATATSRSAIGLCPTTARRHRIKCGNPVRLNGGENASHAGGCHRRGNVDSTATASLRLGPPVADGVATPARPVLPSKMVRHIDAGIGSNPAAYSVDASIDPADRLALIWVHLRHFGQDHSSVKSSPSPARSSAGLSGLLVARRRRHPKSGYPNDESWPIMERRLEETPYP